MSRGCRLTRLAGLARAIGLVADLVILEVAGELCGVLFLQQTLEAPPRRISRLLATALGEIEILDDLIEIDVPVLDDRLVGFFVLEFVLFRLLAHAGRQSAGIGRRELKSDRGRCAMWAVGFVKRSPFGSGPGVPCPQ